MINEYIFPKALKKAMSNGLDLMIFGQTLGTSLSAWMERGYDYIPENTLKLVAPSVLLSHYFAKAFWGEEEVFFYYIDPNNPKQCTEKKLFAWEYYLQQMVISENPIQYLEQFLS